jgi:hypothetical protein
VAERLGFDHGDAHDQTVADLSAYAKGASLGIIEPSPAIVRERSEWLGESEELRVELLGRAMPVVHTPDGLRAVSKGKPGNPAQIEKYLANKFGSGLDAARAAMKQLAAKVEPAELQRCGLRLYERFRPRSPLVSQAGVRPGS